VGDRVRHPGRPGGDRIAGLTEGGTSGRGATGARADAAASPERAAGMTTDAPPGPGPGGASGVRGTAVAVLAYGLAMGYLEAAVVVYLRAALGLGPELVGTAGDAMGTATVGAFLPAEIGREAATLVMIAAVGWLAGRSPVERLAWAAVAFGTWDIAYYVGLWVLIGWPESPLAWDVLFLVPATWVGPVIAPVGVSAALIGFGLAAGRRLRAGGQLRLGRARILAVAAGGVLVVVSFLVDGSRVLAGDTAPWTGWPIYLAGMIVGIAAALSAFAPGPARRAAGPPGDDEAMRRSA
jgi:hypothetical protein